MLLIVVRVVRPYYSYYSYYTSFFTNCLISLFVSFPGVAVVGLCNQSRTPTRVGIIKLNLLAEQQRKPQSFAYFYSSVFTMRFRIITISFVYYTVSFSRFFVSIIRIYVENPSSRTLKTVIKLQYFYRFLNFGRLKITALYCGRASSAKTSINPYFLNRSIDEPEWKPSSLFDGATTCPPPVRSRLDAFIRKTGACFITRSKDIATI